MRHEAQLDVAPVQSLLVKLRKLAKAAAVFARAENKAALVRDYGNWRLFAYRLRKRNEVNRVFDERHRTDTAVEILLQQTGVPEADVARGNTVYRAIWEPDFRQIMRELSFPLEDFTFVDIGSGKGKCMILASDYPFKHIVGVEYSPGLHMIAVSNMASYRSADQRCTSFEPILGDALTYRLPDGPVICLIVNALDPPTMLAFLDKTDSEAATRPDPLLVIYTNMRTVEEMGDVLASRPRLERAFTSTRHVVFCNPPGLALWRKRS